MDGVQYLLCDEVGLGKTIEAGLAIRSLYLTGLVKRVLVAPPASLTQQWHREMAHKSLLPFVPSNCADEKIDVKLWSVDYDLLKNSLSKKISTISGVKKTATLSDALFNAVLDKHPNNLKNHKGRVYSLMLWQLQFGNATQVLETALRYLGKPAHYCEVYECAIKWRPDISKIKAYGILNQNHNALLWDKCVFMHKDNVNVSPGLIRDVEKWLLGAFKDCIPFISITGAFQHFHNLCQRAGITSEVALYSCLRQSDHPELVYQKMPFVYLKKGFKGTIPVSLALENFIRDAGEAGIIRRGFTSSMLGSREVFVIKDGWVVLKELFVDVPENHI